MSIDFIYIDDEKMKKVTQFIKPKLECAATGWNFYLKKNVDIIGR